MKKSRAEVNKDVRRILARHHIDSGSCQFTCFGSEVNFTGILLRQDGSDLHQQDILNLIHEFRSKLPSHTINGDFENWYFSSNDIVNLQGEEECSQEPILEETVYVLPVEEEE